MASSFGRDTSCVTGLRTGRTVTGVRLVAESAYRRLTTPRGMLRGGEEEGNFGLDLTELVGSVSRERDAAALPGRITAELTKDERIESVDVQINETTAAGLTTFQIRIDVQTAEGPFALELAVSEVSIELLGITAET